MTNENPETRLEQAKAYWTEANITEARAYSAEYDDQLKMLVVLTYGGDELHFPICFLEGLADAIPDKISAFHLSKDGKSLHWESLNIDLSIQRLVDGDFGSEAWMIKLKERPDPLLALKRKLTNLQALGDKSEAHLEADNALLSYINDDEVWDLFDSIDKWYS